eukprot:2909822-Rhodomonas_salina.1
MRWMSALRGSLPSDACTCLLASVKTMTTTMRPTKKKKTRTPTQKNDKDRGGKGGGREQGSPRRAGGCASTCACTQLRATVRSPLFRASRAWPVSHAISCHCRTLLRILTQYRTSHRKGVGRYPIAVPDTA